MNNHPFMAVQSPLPSLHYPTPPTSAHHSVTHFGHYPSQSSISTQTYGPNVGQYPFAYENGVITPTSPTHSMPTPVSSQVVPNQAAVATSNGYTSPPGSDSYAHHQFDTTGQVPPPGIRPRVTATLWEDEGTLCYQVEAKGLCVARRGDTNMINGTKLLNVAGMTRGRRDGILKSEKLRQVVKIGPMHLKGVWIPYERALGFANKERITDLLYPLFVHNINALLFNPSNGTRVSAYIANQRKSSIENSNAGSQNESNQHTPQQSSEAVNQLPSPALHSQCHHSGPCASVSDRSHPYNATADGNTSPTAHSNGHYEWPSGVHTHNTYVDPRGVPPTPTTTETPVHPALSYGPVSHPVQVPSYDAIRSYYSTHGSSFPSRWGALNYGPARIPSLAMNNYGDSRYRSQAREAPMEKSGSNSNDSDLSSHSNDDAEASHQPAHSAEDIYTASAVRAPYPNYALNMAGSNDDGLRIVPKLDLGPRNSQSYRHRADSSAHDRALWSPTSPSFGSPLGSPTGCYPASEATRPAHTTGTMASSLYSIMGETQNGVNTASGTTDAMSQKDSTATTHGDSKPSSPSLPRTTEDNAATKLEGEAPSGKYSPPFSNKRSRDTEDVVAKEIEHGRAGRSATISHTAGPTSAVASVGQASDSTDKSCESSQDACKRRRTLADGARPRIASPLSNASGSVVSNGVSASQQ